MNSKLLLIAALFLAFTTANAQSSWQWGKRGGSADTYSGGGLDEGVVDITTDPAGNVYVLSAVMQTSLNVDGHSIAGYGYYDVLISSFKCDGTYRWSKDIGSTDDDEAIAIGTDTLGGVYVTGTLICDALNIHISTDTSWFARSLKEWFIVKYDTAGNYKWFKMPEPDTLTYYFGFSPSAAFDMDVDKGGNSYSVCVLTPGAYSGGAFVATDTAGWNVWYGQGVYLMKFNSSGIFQSGAHLPFRFVGAGGLQFFIRHDNNRHLNYITGNSGSTSGDSLFIGGRYVYAMYLACFDDAGHLLWLKQDAASSGYAGSPYDRPALDNYGNIYLTGACTNGFNFNGSTFNNLFGGETSFIIKLDTNGNNFWAANGSNTDVSSGYGIAVSADTVSVLGFYSAPELIWGTDTVRETVGEMYKLFLCRFNATSGSVIRLDSLVCDFGAYLFPGWEGGGGGWINPGTLVADKYGNFYAGGQMQVDVYIAGDTLYSIGGGSDFFIAKFGSPNCTVPIASLEITSINNQSENIKLYPNPAIDEIIIENASPGATARIFNGLGQQVYNGKITDEKQAINISNLPPGAFLLQVIDANGNRTNKTIIKE